jgi:hypothetical protein
MSDIYVPQSNNWEAEKAKILREAKDQAWAGIPKTASFMMKEQDPYPSPYLNLSDYQIPRTMVEIFKWCRYFYKFDSLVGGAVNALARFPVTDVILDDMEALPAGWDPKKDSPTLELYKQVFEDIKVYDELVKIGIDYWLYGNCFVFGEFTDFSDDPMVPDLRWKHIFRLDPSKITIDIDPLTQEKTYKWDVPFRIKRIVREKRPKAKFDAIPNVIKKAVKENKAVVLNSKNVYHFSREGESGDGSVWGTPLVLNVMKQLAYRNLLRQAQEAIAREHIVPFRVYYLEPSERMDPQANWSNVAAAFGKQLEQAAKDPNYKVVSPVPVNVLNLGGQGRALLLTPEIDQLQAEILAGMGVPREFIFGGVSYSAASISLRTLENQFINYRLLLTDFLNNFIIRRMAEVRGEWRGAMDNVYLVTAKLADLKMQDDVQQKQLIINLNAANKVSDEYMYHMLGMDPAKMKVQLDIEIFERMERERRMQLFQLETDFIMQQTQLQYQAQLQMMVGAPVQTAPGGNGMVAQAQVVPMAPPPEKDVKEKPQKDESTGGTKKVVKEVTKETTKDGKVREITKETTSNGISKEDKKEEKKAFYLGGLESRDVLSPVEQLNIDAIARRIANLNYEDRGLILDKVSSGVKVHLTRSLEKMGVSNPNTISASGNRNVLLGSMTEVDKMQYLKRETENTAQKSNLHNAAVAAQPNPIALPPRRKNLV